MTTQASPVDPVGDSRPVVGRERGNAPLWIFAAIVVALAIWLFAALEGRRERLAAPSVRAKGQDVAAADTLPPLAIPSPRAITPVALFPAPALTPEAVAPPPVPSEPLPNFEPPPSMALPPSVLEAPQPEQSSVLVIDQGDAAQAIAPTEGTAAPPGPLGGVVPARAPARASRLRQRETTIVQGSLIPAVLETALDSTRPGQARALVSQDVRGHGGRYVLIPRGSRLFGEYRADLAPGQNRALVQWTRLDRPDGVTIAIDSPAADALGRAGIRGRVNSHFFERFGAAILQSTLDLGVSVAARSVGDSPVIVALPNGSLATQGIAQGQQIQPTLKVRQGARISVFVARDLDFTAVERQQ